jgi:predicted transposase/invertase (TIGR01784 family)
LFPQKIAAPLTDKQVLHYFELPKLPEEIRAGDSLKLWLALFKAKTEEDLEKIKAMGEVMEQAINAYRQITVSDEFRERERLLHYAKLNEASALANAEQRGRQAGRQEVAMKMKDAGMPPEQIKTFTGISV